MATWTMAKSNTPEGLAAQPPPMCLCRELVPIDDHVSAGRPRPNQTRASDAGNPFHLCLLRDACAWTSLPMWTCDEAQTASNLTWLCLEAVSTPPDRRHGREMTFGWSLRVNG